jgi:hypothetical protein
MSIEKSPEIQHIAAALLAFQAEATGVVKDSKNPHFKNRYASLEAVVDEARPVLQSVGISWMQAPGKITSGNIGMTTLLMHAASGQWLSSDMDIPLGKQDPQGAGSAITYAQRYALMASLGLPPVDDDAEAAMPRNHQSAPMSGRNVHVSSGVPAHSGTTLSANARLMVKASEMSMTKQEVTDWVRANGEAIDGLPGDEPERIRDHARSLYSRLPEKAAA